jgi:hypothetical protein
MLLASAPRALLAQLSQLREGFGQALLLVFMVGFPERAIDTLIHKEVQKHDSEMKLIEKQLPAAKAFYEAQDAQAKARIDRELEGVKPLYRDKTFVNAVFRESDRQTRREFANPSAGQNGTKPAAPKVAAA